MADTEFRAPPSPAREPTFVKPLDTASRRRSRASHDSAAASTRSWVLMTQQNPPPPAEPIPLPEPVPALAPGPGPMLTPTTPTPQGRPLPEPPRRISVLGSTGTGAEHMAVEVPSPDAAAAGLGYQWTAARGAKAREAHQHREGKSFVGGFVSGLRRLPRALVRTRNGTGTGNGNVNVRARRGTAGTEGTEGTEGTGMTGNTLPRYASNPPTPVVDAASVAFMRNQDGDRRGVGGVEEGRRLHPSFRVDPPEEDLQQAIVTPIVYKPEEEDGPVGGDVMPGALDAPLENPYDREFVASTHIPAAISTGPGAASPHPSRADDRLTLPAPALDGDEPVSVHAHPLPAEDYRRMSAQDVAAGQPNSRTTISSGSFSSRNSPSFSAELSGAHRFFQALHLLPWVATDRVTADYRPKAKAREGESWYHPAAEPGARGLEDGEEEQEDEVEREHGERAAVHSPASGSDAPPRRYTHTRTRSPPRHRTHRRATTSPDPPPPPATPPLPFAYNYSYYPAFSPLPPQPQTPPSPPQQSRRPPSGRAHTRSSRPHAHRQHRRSATYHAHSPGSWSPPAPTMLPAPPAPVYIIQATPPLPHALPPSALASTPPALNASASPLPGSGGMDAGVDAGARAEGDAHGHGHGHAYGYGAQGAMLAPVYMQMPVQMQYPYTYPSASPPSQRSSGSPPPGQGYTFTYPYAYPSSASPIATPPPVRSVA
ncbi:hypothetical protein B0H11DRAFT_2048569 [Mycena galericulata]|nr:hypothetical protein B0H11DRAFT_2048569 [Mycena galericulata]